MDRKQVNGLKSAPWPQLATWVWMGVVSGHVLAGHTTQPTTNASQPSETPFVSPAPPTGQPAPITLEPIKVTAERREQSIQDVPASITAIDGATIRDAQIENVKQAGYYAPNLFFSQFSPMRVSNPYIRGVGSGQNSPGVATYIDGVPQLSYSTSNIELVDIDHFEFLRGPQSTLYGRSALGGVININSIQPDNTFRGDLTFSGGTFSQQDYRGGISGPLVQDKAYFAFAGGYESRDGFTKNLATGDNLDNVNNLFGRFELRFTPTPQWDLRVTIHGEEDHDGDFPIADLSYLKANPWRVDHDYTGIAHRDIDEIAFTAIYHGYAADFTSVSAVQHWREKENTDLDESPYDAERRFNNEKQTNYIEEMRLVSPTNRPVVLNDNVKVSWVLGSLFFVTNDSQVIDDQARPLVTDGPFNANSFTNANTDTYGIGVYAQGTLTLWNKLDITGGARVDYEYNSAALNSYVNVPGPNTQLSRDDTQVSPQASIDYHLTKELMPYVSVSRGFRAGGFNSTPPIPTQPGQNTFGTEQSWSYETGIKTSWLENHLLLNADYFFIDWKHLQLNVPNDLPSEFYIQNAGRAHSTGCEAEGKWIVNRNFSLFGGFGFTDARFDHYIQPNGVSAHGNRLPQAPETTWNIGGEATADIGHGLRVFGRAEWIGFGSMAYDSSNALEQGAYTLTDFRIGIGGENWRLEGFINNAFQTHYFPVAFPFPGTASGYVGQEGDPRTMGITLGITF